MYKNSFFKSKWITWLIYFMFMSFTIPCQAFAQAGTNTASSGAVSNASQGTMIVGSYTGEALPDPGNVTVNFKDVDILTVLNYLSEVSGVDIIPSPGVTGKVTMRLRNKPWEVALDIAARNYGYAYSRDGDIIRIMPRSMLQTEDTVTEVIPLDHIIRDIELVRSTSATMEDVGITEKEETIKQVMTAVNSMLDKSRGENATYVTGANALVITAIPAKINTIKEMLTKVDKKTPQILLDAKVIEILLDDSEQLGIDWNVLITAAGAKRPISLPFTNQGILKFLPGYQRDYYPTNTVVDGRTDFPFLTNTGVPPLAPAYSDDSLFTYGTLDFSRFTATLSLLSEREGVNILSSPRITTLNNQKATIKVIEKIMLQKTQETTQTAGIVTVEFEKEADAREVGVKLTILPHVNSKDEITVNLMPEVSNRSGGVGGSGFDVIPVGLGLETVALTFASREANTRVRVNDGETIFIGGLIKETKTKTDHKLPVLGDLLGGVPWVKYLVKYESDAVEKTEIVFFVTVHLIKEPLDSILDSQTVDQYKKYCVPGKGEGAGTKGEEGSVIRTGELAEREETEAVSAASSAGEKPRKAWFNFGRKK